MKVGDLVEVVESPGAPFDIGEIFTVESILQLPLGIKVKERPWRFNKDWLRLSNRSVPSPSVERINGHTWLVDHCVDCHSTYPKEVCLDAPI